MKQLRLFKTMLLMCLLLSGISNAWGEIVSDNWDLTSSSSDWTATGNVAYFGQPYGYKAVNGTLTNKSIDDFSVEGKTQIKVGFKCLQNGAETSKLTIYLVDNNGNPIGDGVEVTPVNASSASNTTYQYATFDTNLANATGFMMKVTTFEKNILVNGASYEITYIGDGSGSIKIDADKIENFSGSYTPRNWTHNGISGKCFAYRAGSSAPYLMQFNNTPYVYNVTPVPGRIKSITITKGGGNDKTWSIYCSNDPLTSITGGIKVGDSKLVSSSTTWEMPSNSNYTYFYLTKESGATQISEFLIEYESAVPEKTLQSIEVSGTPTKTTYDEGETFDPAGLTVTGTYDDGTTTPISDEDISWNITPETLVAGTTSVSVTVTVGNITSPSYTVTGIVVNAFPTLTSIDDIFNKATEVGGDETKVRVVFGNWVVSGVSINGKNVYVTNGEKGFIIFNNGANMGFVAGDMLSGTAICKVLMYNQSAELKELSSTTEGLVVTKGGTVNPQHVETSQLSGINTGRVISFENISFDGTNFTDGTNTIKPYNQLYQYDNLAKDESYDVTGVYLRYGDDNEILPRDASDIERHSYTTSYTITIETPENGSIFVTREDGTTVNSGDTAYQGEKILIHAEPNPGYRCETIDITSSTKTSFWGNDKLWTMGGFDITISATIVPIPTYTINWSVNGEIIKTDENVLEGTDLAAPADPVSELSFFTDYEFKGWVTDPNKVLPNTVPVFANPDKAVANTTYYAVFATKAGDGVDEWVRQTTVPSEEEGEYLIVNETAEDVLVNVMRASISSNRFENGNAQVVGDNVIAETNSTESFPSADEVWRISKSGDFYTFFNVETGKFAGGNNKENQVALLEDSSTDFAKWTITLDENTHFVVENHGRIDSKIRYLRNNKEYGWATYVSTTGNAPVFYKRIPGYTDFTVYPPLVLDEATETITKEYKGTYRRVKAKRTIKADSWNTLCLPFEMSEKQIADNLGGAEIYELTGLEMDGNYNIMVFKPVATMKAATPYMVRVPNQVDVINMENIFVDYYDGDLTSEASSGNNRVVIHGTYKKISAPICEKNAQGEYIRRYFISSSGILFPVDSKVPVKGFRGYFDVPTADTYTILLGMPNEILIKENPVKKGYSEGESFEPSGLVITATYSYENSDREIVNHTYDFPYAGFERCFTFSPDLDTPLTSDDQIVKVTFGGASADLPITVNVATYTVIFNINDGEIEVTEENVIKGSYVNAPEVDDMYGKAFTGWVTSETIESENTPDYIDFKTHAINGNMTFYAVFATQMGDGSERWIKVTDRASMGNGIYALISDDGYAFDGTFTTGSSSHGNATESKFNFNEEGFASTAPEGTCLLTITNIDKPENASSNRYTIYSAADNKYLYISAAKSGYLNYNESADGNYWESFINSNQDNEEQFVNVRQSNTAQLRFYNGKFRSGSTNTGATVNGSVVSFAQKVGSEPILSEFTTRPGYTRSELTDGQLGTICLPYKVKADRVSGATFYEIDSKRLDDDGKAVSLVLNVIEDDLEAGVPYIFKAEENAIYAPFTCIAADKAESINGLIGTFEDCAFKNMTDEERADVYVITNNKVQKASAKSGVKKYRAYIKMNAVPNIGTSGAKQVVLDFDGDMTTGVTEINTYGNGNGNYYNIAGQRVNANHKGIIIVNGRKYINK